jgi:ABC-type glycerol-3-phosphate transport system substrate-binding protein
MTRLAHDRSTRLAALLAALTLTLAACGGEEPADTEEPAATEAPTEMMPTEPTELMPTDMGTEMMPTDMGTTAP